MSLIERLKTSLRDKYILHPVLVIIYFILHNTIEFGDEAFRWYEPAGSLVVLLIVTYLLDRLLSRFFKDKFNSRYILTFILVSILFYQDIFYFIKNYFFYNLRHRHVLSFLFLILISLFFKLKTVTSRLPNLFLNVLFLIYISIDIISLLEGNNYFGQRDTAFSHSAKNTSKNHPDVYLILLDGYANNKSLDKYYKYDNTAFTDSLKKLGFYFVKNSRSNYPFTVQTVSSMLNLDYLKPTQKNVPREFLEYIYNNKVVSLYEDYGYSIHNLSAFHFKNYHSKYVLKFFINKSSFAFFLLSKCIIYDIINKGEKGEGVTRELNILKGVNFLVKNENSTTPKFVYAHLLLTHSPFYLNDKYKVDKTIYAESPSLTGILPLVDDDTTNNTLGSSRIDSTNSINYINHVRFTNIKALELCSKLTKRNSIVILLSDHGSRMLSNPISNYEAVKERYMNFCAIYYPDGKYNHLYDSITPVNVIRQVLNKSLGTKFSNLEDKSGLEVR
ncbi:Sulfatase [Pseudarcicella hirudinis]|uniref:Sulfatase n=1 Tax=Pseudarcicella hirudinis TaxID=1079859 RepID=A0A1I5VSQ6_9BACT|nr:sulfatase-like hydrolase/transferase [Pseudarcicella hirudinis]SFQ10490.1 Sulfatase [Pseudarcicella hirudinis]